MSDFTLTHEDGKEEKISISKEELSTFKFDGIERTEKDEVKSLAILTINLNLFKPHLRSNVEIESFLEFEILKKTELESIYELKFEWVWYVLDPNSKTMVDCASGPALITFHLNENKILKYEVEV
jgi:predicted NUDIX family phosphoesterase